MKRLKEDLVKVEIGFASHFIGLIWHPLIILFTCFKILVLISAIYFIWSVFRYFVCFWDLKLVLLKFKTTFSTPSTDSVRHMFVIACAGFPILLVSCNLITQTGYPCFYFRKVSCSIAETGVIIKCWIFPLHLLI